MKKQQTRKLGTGGSLTNQIMGNNDSLPKVGEGATILLYSDRNPYIVKAINSKKVTLTALDKNLQEHEDSAEIEIEWNAKKESWMMVSYEVEIIKSLKKKLWKEFDYDWHKNLPKGITLESLIVTDEFGTRRFKLVSGYTKEYKKTSPISIIFGKMEYYRDPCF